MPMAAVIPAVASIGSAAIGAIGGAGQKGAVDSSNAAAQKNFAQARTDLMPYMTAGTNALGQESDLLGLNGQAAADAAMATYQKSPGYQFQMDQGLRAVDAGAAAKGMLRSGATIKGEETFGQGLANSDFGQYYNRLFGMSGQGLTATGDETRMLAGAAQADIGQGNAQSSIFGNAATGLGNSVNSLFSNPRASNSLFGTPVSGPGTFQIGPGPGAVAG
jgi:hypothetical protein